MDEVDTSEPPFGVPLTSTPFHQQGSVHLRPTTEVPPFSTTAGGRDFNDGPNSGYLHSDTNRCTLKNITTVHLECCIIPFRGFPLPLLHTMMWPSFKNYLQDDLSIPSSLSSELVLILHRVPPQISQWSCINTTQGFPPQISQWSCINIAQGFPPQITQWLTSRML